MEPFSLGTGSRLQPRDGGRATLRADDAIQRAGFIDLHQDMLSGVAQIDGGLPGLRLDLPRPARARAAAVWSSLYPAHPGRLAPRPARRPIATCSSSHSSSLRLITTVADLDAEDSRTGVLPHSEGFHLPAVGCRDARGAVGGALPAQPRPDVELRDRVRLQLLRRPAAPLKPAGRRPRSRARASPLFLDLAHLNEAGFYEALELYAPPVLVTHSFCRAIVDHPRGLADDQLRALGEHGGSCRPRVLPRLPRPTGSVDEALRHVDRIASLAGEDAVSIGSDWGVAPMGELGDPAALAELMVAAVEQYLRPDARREVRVRQRVRLPSRPAALELARRLPAARTTAAGSSFALRVRGTRQPPCRPGGRATG